MGLTQISGCESLDEPPGGLVVPDNDAGAPLEPCDLCDLLWTIIPNASTKTEITPAIHLVRRSPVWDTPRAALPA